ncbi:hypothetical protein IV203_008541 [Nitzschia inconspicua]|uniref:Uncharacterized protein n=1 Tax=Nitzschia inconspicua TaxID=303405 RepID=A0A9K3KYX8_9STRA|nr:hypothetical protein IV203_008541 [Nitzschia inconspicua]
MTTTKISFSIFVVVLASMVFLVVATIWNFQPSENILDESEPALLLPASSIFIRSIGEPIMVWSSLDTWKKCRLIDVPDIPARVFVTNTTHTHRNPNLQMICGAVGYHEMHGPSLLNQTRSCDISWNATKDGDPSHFAGNEFIDSTVRFDNGTVIALIHTEYPGERYNACDTAVTEKERESDDSSSQPERQRRYFDALNLQNPLTYPTCWMVTIGLGISFDWGHTWQHIAEPPHHLVAAVPYTYKQEFPAYGWGDPNNIVRNPNDGYYYVTVWNRNQVGVQGPGICVMRTNDLMDPKSWRAWNGSKFAVPFVDPYRVFTPSKREFDPKDHVCETLDIPGTTREDCNMFGVLWNNDLRQFIGTVGCDTDPNKRNTFFFTTSTDVIHWSPIQEMYHRSRDLPPEVAAMTTSIHYPTLLDSGSFSKYGDTNFYTVGKTPYLFWTGTGHSPYKDGRHLWATPMEVGTDDSFSMVVR